MRIRQLTGEQGNFSAGSIQRNGIIGPLETAELRERWKNEEITRETLCCRSGTEDWKPLEAFVDEFYASVSSPSSQGSLAEAEWASIAKWVRMHKEGIGKVLATLLIFACLMALSNSCRQASKRRQKMEDQEAMFQAAKQTISDRLRSPASAKFCQWKDVKQDMILDDYGRLHGWVDSQNGFGALLRSDWEVVVDKKDGIWTAKDVEIDTR